MQIGSILIKSNKAINTKSYGYVLDLNNTFITVIAVLILGNKIIITTLTRDRVEFDPMGLYKEIASKGKNNFIKEILNHENT